MALQEPCYRHRWDPGIAFEHLDERILDGKSQHITAFFAQYVGNRLQNGALARTRYALNGDDAVVRAQDQSPCPFLAMVEGHAISEFGERLQPLASNIGGNNRRYPVPPFIDRIYYALLKSKRGRSGSDKTGGPGG